jgi:hypothetical protein
LKNKITLNELIIFDRCGIPLTSSATSDILQGGLLAAISSFIKHSFNSELNELKLGKRIIVFKHSENFMASICLNDSDGADMGEADNILNELLCYLERLFPDFEKNQLNIEKLGHLVDQYVINML